MKRTILFLSSVFVLTALAFAPLMQAQHKASTCGACRFGGCTHDCSPNGSCGSCCNGK
jgi:hypothetical protein